MDENMKDIYNNEESNDDNFRIVDEEIYKGDEENTNSFDDEPVSDEYDVEYYEEEERESRTKWLKIVLIALVFGIVAGAAWSVTNVTVSKFANSKIKINSTQSYLTKTEDSSDINSPIADIVEECMPSIVSITNKSINEVMTFFGTYSQESTSSGSGIILGKNDTELLIVSNYHVVAGSTELSVLFSDPNNKDESTGIDVDNPQSSTNIFQAKVKGYDSDKDLAVISVKLDDIPADILSHIKVATIGNSSTVRAGERVIAIGNALGYGQSVTTGIISATNRSVTLESQSVSGTTVTNEFIQTDAAINPGNSGGALLNMKGELIGINSVKISANGIEGMGYAIPISDVEEIIGDLMVIETRDVVDEDEQGFLGITGQDISSEVSKAYGMPVGVFVSSVSEGMAADRAGIKKGYIITKFDNHAVRTIAQLQERLTYYKKGETKKITVQVSTEDGYEERELDITLGSKKTDSAKMAEEQK